MLAQTFYHTEECPNRDCTQLRVKHVLFGATFCVCKKAPFENPKVESVDTNDYKHVPVEDERFTY